MSGDVDEMEPGRKRQKSFGDAGASSNGFVTVSLGRLSVPACHCFSELQERRAKLEQDFVESGKHNSDLILRLATLRRAVASAKEAAFWENSTRR